MRIYIKSTTPAIQLYHKSDFKRKETNKDWKKQHNYLHKIKLSSKNTENRERLCAKELLKIDLKR